MLSDMGMDVYDPSDVKARNDGKVDAGNIHHGTDVLGYRISGNSREPCAAAQRKFLEKLDRVVISGKREMKAAVCGTSSSHHSRFHHSMVQFHDIVWGWSQAFRHTTAKHVFEQLDKKIDKRIAILQAEARRLAPPGNICAWRRVSGVHLLADTQVQPLPDIGGGFDF
jgi:RNA-directed DNA polymerase